MTLYKILAASLTALIILACEKDACSTKDPLPLPQEMEDGKDLSVKAGDSFFEYCNGSWLKKTEIPAEGALGGLYDQEPAMNKRVEQLRADVPDIGRFFELLEAESGNPEASKSYLDAQKARFPKPTTKEEAFLTMGKMMADGITMWPSILVPTFSMLWKEGRMVGCIVPYIDSSDVPLPTEWDPAEFVPLTSTKAGGKDSAPNLIIKGMGLDPSLFATDPSWDVAWEKMENRSLEELCALIDNAWAYYDQFAAAQLTDTARGMARASVNYTLSYHFQQKFMSAAFKEKYLGITKDVQASLRKRIQAVDWMSETTKNNALDKLDSYQLYVAYPDQWYTDGVAALSNCATLAEAVHRCNRGTAIMKGHLLGGKDYFSYQITTMLLSSTKLTPSDLSLVNAMYSPQVNAVFIYPALLLPPYMPENVSAAYEYAAFVSIGHEFTHGFDNNGSKYDKWGNKRNWWTVADQMAFEDLRDNIVECYCHLEVDPVRAPGVYGDGNNTQGENIADLGGFLTCLDAYKARLTTEGYKGETYKDQLRKFYESYAHCWCVQYSNARFAYFPKQDVHSPARHRVDGVVMNTDLWYELYGVDRNNILYLPKERRTYIW